MDSLEPFIRFPLRSHSLLFLSFLLLLSGCGEKLSSTLSPPQQKVRQIYSYSLEGEFPSTEGSIISLSKQTQRPLILLFASPFCQACQEEMEEIKESFSPSSKPPSTVDFYTVLIYEEMEEAKRWKEEQDVPWVVGIDLEGKLFHRFCPKEQTPCTVVFHPQHGMLLNQHGKVSVQTLKTLVGPW